MPENSDQKKLPPTTRRTFVGTLLGIALTTTPNNKNTPHKLAQNTCKEPSTTMETTTPISVTITVDTDKPLGTSKPIWRFFGADEPNYAYLRDGKKLLGELGELAADHVYFRTHNLLTSGDGTPALKWGSTNAYTEDADGNPIYNWTILDRIFDTYRASHVRPYVQIGFMPEALSIKPQPYQHAWTPTAKYDEIYTGWAYPPKDYKKWEELVYQWTKHCVERYGRPEVETWYWETWNEPNIGYWRGTPAEFHQLHDHAIAGVLRALPTAKVGGCDTAGGPGGNFLKDFLTHCHTGKNYATGETGTPLHFIAFHAKGSPKYIPADTEGNTTGYVRMGIANQLRNINDAFALVATFPDYKNLPLVIGESDPDGCAACQGPQLGYRNTTLFSSYTAASIARMQTLADKHGVNLEGTLTWAFEFEDYPLFAGFRVLATGGIDLPVLNVFRMLSKLGNGDRLTVNSTAETPLDTILTEGVRTPIPDIAAHAVRTGNKIALLIWHYHDDDLPGPDAEITLTLNALPATNPHLRLTHYRIDHDHSNAYTLWQKMGSPAKPNPEQYNQLEQGGKLAKLKDAPATVTTQEGKATLSFSLPRQGVSLLLLEE